MIRDENDVLTNDELVVVTDFLKKLKHACPYIRNKDETRTPYKKYFMLF